MANPVKTDGQKPSPALSPTAMHFSPAQPPTCPPMGSDRQMEGRELALGLTVGYVRFSPEQIEARVRGSTRTAAVTIIDATGATTNPLASSSTHPQPVQLKWSNFLSLMLKPDGVGKNISLLFQLKVICNFIDGHYATLAEDRAREQEAARGFDDDDDELFCGQSVLGKTGNTPSTHVMEDLRPDREVIIHGGRTERTQAQPTFVALAYLMRKYRIGVSEAIDKAQRFDSKWAGVDLYLTPHQREQLEVWHACEYELFENNGQKEVPKQPYGDYFKGWFNNRLFAHCKSPSTSG